MLNEVPNKPPVLKPPYIAAHTGINPTFSQVSTTFLCLLYHLDTAVGALQRYKCPPYGRLII